MAEHLPECPLLEPCSADIPQHGFCSRQNTICIHCDQNTICIHCERECICDRLRACEERVHREISAETLAGFRYDYEQGAYDMRERAIEVIEGLKVEGDPYVIGSVALFHIRALKEKQ